MTVSANYYESMKDTQHLRILRLCIPNFYMCKFGNMEHDMHRIICKCTISINLVIAVDNNV